MAKNFLKALDEPTELEQTLDGRQMGARSSAERQQARGAQTQAMGELFDWLKTAKKTYDVHGQVARGAFSEAVDNPLFRWLREKGLRPEMLETATDLWAPGVGMVKGMARGAGKTAKKLAVDPSDWMQEGETLAQALTRKGSLAPTMKVSEIDVEIGNLRSEMEQVNRVKKSFESSGLEPPQHILDMQEQVKKTARRIGKEVGAMRKASTEATRRLDMVIDPNSAMGKAMGRVGERGVTVGGFPLPGASGSHQAQLRELGGKGRHSVWLRPDKADEAAIHEWTHAIFTDLDKPARQKLIDAYTGSGKTPHPSVTKRIGMGTEGGMKSMEQEFREFPYYASELAPRTVNEGLSHTLEDLLTPGEGITTEPQFLHAVFDLMGDPNDLFRKFRHRMPDEGAALQKLLEGR